MQNRRDFILGSAASAILMQLSACASESKNDYEKTIAGLRAPLAANPDFIAFVRFATLAPSGHNTQPWRFASHETGASIQPDFSRRTSIVDPDDHHLFVSLGCAAENFLIAAGANGRPGEIIFDGSGQGRFDIELSHGPARPDSLYRAIPSRQSTRSNYDGRAVSNENLRRLEDAASIPGVSILTMTNASKRESVLDYLTRANSFQMENPAFVTELRDWVRFNHSQALSTGDGLFSTCSGNPTLPTWIGKRMFSQFFKKDAENAKYIAQLRSSAGIAVFIGHKADKDHWIKVGRSFQRFALQATALGIRHALINQPVEVPLVRADFSRWLGVGDARPDLIVRFGTAPPMPMSMRRPVETVILAHV
jgi:hypothetical protein